MALKGLGGNHSAEASEADAEIVAEINITPLTDVFLVLLIIFMVTSSVMTQLGVDVNLPQASNAISQSQPEGIILTLLSDGGVKIGNDVIAADRLPDIENKLKTAFGRTNSRLVILEGDRKAFLGSAVQVMDYARKGGADKFAIATQPE